MHKKKGMNPEIKKRLNSLIGKKVKILRTDMGLSQSEFAKGANIYQESISRIESNKGANIYTLKRIAEFVNVDVGYFLQGYSDLEEEQKKEYMDWVRTLVSEHQFEEAEHLLKAPPFTFIEPKDLQFLSWHKGIVQAGLYNNQKQAIQLFDQAIFEAPGTFRTERQIEIMISKGVAILDSGDPDKATINFEEAENGLRYLSIPYNPKIIEIIVRIAYNRAAAYYDMRDYIKSIFECEKALRIINRHKSSYLAGELHYQYGLSHFFAGNIKVAEYHIKGSIFLFQSAEKEKWAIHAKQKLVELGLT